MEEHILSLKKMIEIELEKYISTLEKEPKNLYQPLVYSLELQGKRIRPILTLLSYSLFDKKEFEEVLPCALAIELFHNFSLIHDDIMDDSILRRGKPTVFSKWKKNNAILSGDVMLIHCFSTIFKYYSMDKSHFISKSLSQAAVSLCEGQQWDMQFEKEKNINREQYMKMIALKTATLFSLSLHMGAYIAKASKEQIDLLKKIGLELGIVFQLIDDYLDVYGEEGVFGKKMGKDIINSKKTILFVEVFESGGVEEKKEIQEVFTMPPSQGEEKIEKAKKLFEKCNVAQKVEIEIKKRNENMFSLIDRLEIKKTQKDNLLKIVYFLQKRKI